MNRICIIFVCNLNYINNFISSYEQLLNNGKYKEDVCLIIGNDLYNTEIIEKIKDKYPLLIIKYFEDFYFNHNFYEINNKVKSDGRNLTKRFQWHKINVFDIFFKKWQYILYIDSGMNIYNNIEYIIQQKEENTIIAHYDGYPNFEWKLRDQFDNTLDKFIDLNTKYNLNIDYFQTGMMLFDSNIINIETKNNIYKLAILYPISKTNEQGIIALYFTNIDKRFKPLKINNNFYNLYDYNIRDNTKDYIMTKY
jgi:hypothetical protein